MTGSVWIVSYVMLWVAVVVLGVTVVALLRQIGVLHLRVAPMGVHFAGRGPGARSTGSDHRSRCRLRRRRGDTAGLHQPDL